MYQRHDCHDIYQYWNALRAGHAAPLRNQIDPTDLRSALPDLFILELKEDGDLLFRLVGTRMCNLFGRELKGHAFHELWMGGATTQPIEIARASALHESPVFLNLTGIFEDESVRSFEMILLPLRSSDGLCDRLLGALLPSPTEGRLDSTYRTLRALMIERSRPISAPEEKDKRFRPKPAPTEDDPWGLPSRKPVKSPGLDELPWFTPENKTEKA